MVETVCSASSPPLMRSTTAITPVIEPQKIRCQSGVSVSPCLDASISITSAPESALVTKNTATMTTATKEMMPRTVSAEIKVCTPSDTGKWLIKAKSAFELPSCPRSTSLSSIMPSLAIMSMAELPKVVIQKKVKPAGIKSTPPTKLRMVRPREMRAMNIPTNGDQAIHQPQYAMVQPPSQPSVIFFTSGEAAAS